MPEKNFSENSKTPLNPESWVDQHGDYLFSFAFFRVQDQAAAEDLVWWEISEEEFKNLEIGTRYCTVYPKGIPASVEDSSECPKFIKREDVDVDL